MRALSTIGCLFGIAAGSGLLAQTYHWPAALATAPGNAVLNAPFSCPPGHPANRTRCMVVFDPAQLPFAAGTSLTQVAMRRDVAYPNQAYAAVPGTLTVKLGRVLVVPDRVQDVRFARLWDGVPTTVYSGAFTLPAAPAPGTSLPPFQVVIQFTRNFPYAGGPLAIEFVFAPASGSSVWRVDGFARSVPVHGTFRPAGPGCPGSNGFSPHHYPLPETTMPGAVLTLELEGAARPASPSSLENFAFHLLGLQNSTYLGQPLPIDLATFGGVPGCLLRMEPVITTTVLVGNPSALFARATAQVALPAHAGLVGMGLYSQWLQFDGNRSAPFPVIASDAQAITLGQIAPPPGPHSSRTLWKYGAGNVDIDCGRLVPADHGPVLRWN